MCALSTEKKRSKIIMQKYNIRICWEQPKADRDWGTYSRHDRLMG